MSRKIFPLLIVVMALFWVTGTIWAAETAAPGNNQLQNSDCIKCHQEEVKDIDTRGAKHKQAVTCLDCHKEHPPAGENAIPQCSECHDPADQQHFKVGSCTGCHNPHHPLEIDISSDDQKIKSVCLSCHQRQGEEMKSYPSKHAELNCAECHPKHATFRKCLECHEPHADYMAYADCLRCHKPHMPAVVRYDEKVPSKYCGSCHDKEFGMLAANQSKHHLLLCVYCHKSQHKLVPECITCHGEPHGADIHKKFPDCLTCHIDAHALEHK